MAIRVKGGMARQSGKSSRQVRNDARKASRRGLKGRARASAAMSSGRGGDASY